MTQTAPCPRPPRFSAWFVELFVSADQAESILGDLAEEFSDVASKSGVVPARRWYWRQSVKTIFHLAGAAFRGAPWSFVGIVLMGFLLKWFVARLPEQIVIAILRTQRPYSNLHYGFYVWLLSWGFPIVRITLMTFTGCIVAVLAKGKEIVVTMALIIASSFVFGLHFYLRLQAVEISPQIPIPWIFVFQSFENCMAILLGGILIRQIRSDFPRQEATP